MFSKEVLVSMLGGVLRILLGGVSIWAVEKGIATQEQIGLLIIGLAGFLGTVIWMWMNKAKARVELLTGLTVQPGTSVDELKAQIKAGCAVPVATPNDATPRAVMDAGSVKPPSGNMGVILLPLLLAGSVGISACGGAIKPPVITGEDQAQVQKAGIKALAGIEVAGVVVRDAMKMVNDLRAAGVVSSDAREAIATAVRQSSDIALQVIDQIAAATRLVTVEQLTAQVTSGILSVADLLEKQSDTRIQTAGRILRTAVGALSALIGGAK